MSKLYTIETDGSFLEQDVPSPPPWNYIKGVIGCRTMEHVAVLFNGKPAHMYVDEDGISKELSINLRASRIYSNVTLRRAGLPTYDDLTEPLPGGLVSVGSRELKVVGRVVLWTGNALGDST